MAENSHYNFYFFLKPFAVLFQPKVIIAIVLLGVVLTEWTSGKDLRDFLFLI